MLDEMTSDEHLDQAAAILTDLNADDAAIRDAVAAQAQVAYAAAGRVARRSTS
jgi:hypothetical protein